MGWRRAVLTEADMQAVGQPTIIIMLFRRFALEGFPEAALFNLIDKRADKEIHLIFYHRKWDGDLDEPLRFSFEDVEAAHNYLHPTPKQAVCYDVASSEGCICNSKYTGLRWHKKACPMKGAIK